MRPLLTYEYDEHHPLTHAIALMRFIQKHHNPYRGHSSIVSAEHRALSKNKDLQALFFLQPEITFTIDWDALMATKSNKPSFNLIDYRLTDSELDQYEKWLETQTITLQNLLAQLAEKDYKVSFTFVENSEAWCVSVTGKQDAKFNSESTLTTWSDDALDGLAMAIFKVFVVFGGGVWKTKTQSRRG